ncbi:MAG: endonuclease III [Lentisphaerae bacterium ADurb.BinA184]|nr:MAG: endonuclease III [Lentisphaerae bacterium ADurb.BinA184]
MKPPRPAQPRPAAPARLTPRLTLAAVYTRLLEAYGPQGWWPLLNVGGANPTATGTGRGYHPADYTFPHNDNQRFEICVGAVLTQNTAWTNVERALAAMAAHACLTPDAILNTPPEQLARLIRPAGYFNAKARKLRELAAFWRSQGGTTPSRQALLAVWGIGPETADSIRLYAYGQTEMVVDAYTRRVLASLGKVAEDASYEAVKRHCVARLPAELPVYQEFHALLVEHAKRLRTEAGRRR